VLCLDGNTGREVWRHRYGWPWEFEGKWPGPYATPTVAQGKVYFAGAYGLIGCLDGVDGSAIWSVNVTEAFEGSGTEFGYACSPLVEDGRVIMPVGGEGAAVVALDAEDGSTVWRSGDEPASYSPALPVTVDGRRQIVCYLRNVVVGLDPQTGAQLWEHRVSDSYDEHSSWPLYEAPYLMVCAAFKKGSRLLELGTDADGPFVKCIRESERMSNDIASSVLVDGYVYGFDLADMQPNAPGPRGQFTCMKLVTGEVCWTTDRVGHATLITADGKLIILNEMGELILARQTPEGYDELARTRIFTEGRCWTAPVLRDGRLFLRNGTEAVCVYLDDPAHLAGTVPSPVIRGASWWERAIAGHAYWRGQSLTAPALLDVLRWYGASIVGVFVAASVVTAAVGVGVRLLVPSVAGRVLPIVLSLTAFVLGAVGTHVLTAALGVFVFTWPAALFVVFQLTVVSVLPAADPKRASRLTSSIAVAAFAALCVGYFLLCRSLFVVTGYGFLVGFLPAAPFAVLAARRFRRDGICFAAIAWSVAAFTVYFWASGLFAIWRTRL
jgi:outer membrane protein assembly factor BamB